MEIYFNIQVDCESTDPGFNNPTLGERAVRGLGEIFANQGMKATFVVVPSDMKIHAHIYRDLEAQGHEIGLHTHPAAQGYGNFLGVYSFEDQLKIIGEGADVYTEKMGHQPKAFTPGYCSANDLTFPVLESLGFTQGTVSMPTRNLPQCACVWGNSPLDAHYPHRYNRCLTGDVNFVDLPLTLDPDSRMWGGAHPQDLRIELVDAKNHWYTIHKSVCRQVAAADNIPVKHLKAATHNTFDYSDPHNFRRETLLGVIAGVRQVCEQEGVTMVPATTGEIAEKFRAQVPLPKGDQEMKLDTRGRAFSKTRLTVTLPIYLPKSATVMILDAHTHIIPRVEGLPNEKVSFSSSKALDVEQYLDTFAQLGVQACFTFGWNSLYLDSYCRSENEALAKLNQQYPERIYAWGTVSPAWDEQRLRAEIRYAIRELKLYGLKFVPICQGISLTNPGFDIIAYEAIALDVPVTTHDGSPEYCSAIQVAYYARKYPRLRVLSAHGGLRELWPDLIDAARELPNLYICLSGPTQWGIQHLYDALGPEKLMFGSDGGCGPAAITTAYLRRIERLKAPAAHKDMILGENALSFIKGL